MVGTPPFFYEFLEHIQNGGNPQDFRPNILGGPVIRNRAPAVKRASGNTRRDKVPLPKKKRKISRYQKVFGKHLKQLKKKHPRTDISVLMKKAHRLTKKELK